MKNNLKKLNQPSVDLNWLFDGLDDYCIIKISGDFPYYEKNSDLDIICDDKFKFAEILKNKILNKYNAKINNYIASNNNLQLDVITNNSLDIKFDLTDDLSCWQKIRLKPQLAKLILSQKVKKNSTFVPCLEHEVLTRLLEYEEYKKNPSKIKHLNFANQRPLAKNIAKQLIQDYKFKP